MPPVLLDTPVARESCGDAAIYVPLGHVPATTRALESLLFDQATRTRMLCRRAARNSPNTVGRALRADVACGRIMSSSKRQPD